jgi:hypothetical protein
MNRGIRTIAVLSFITLSLGIGCGTGQGPGGQIVTPLSQYIRQYKFTPFDVPRDGDGDGTVIAFNNGQETIVAGPNECLSPTSIARDQSNVFLVDMEYEVTRNAKLELQAAKVLESSVDIGGAFNDERVKKVKVRWVDPFRRRITELGRDTYLKQLPKDSACHRVLTDKRNLIIHTILGANGVEYSFIGENDSAVSLDAKLLDQMNLGGQLRSQFEGKGSLVVSRPVFMGYRAWKGSPASGFAVSTIEITELEPSEIEERRRVSRQR